MAEVVTPKTPEFPQKIEVVPLPNWNPSFVTIEQNNRYSRRKDDSPFITWKRKEGQKPPNYVVGARVDGQETELTPNETYVTVGVKENKDSRGNLINSTLTVVTRQEYRRDFTEKLLNHWQSRIKIARAEGGRNAVLALYDEKGENPEVVRFTDPGRNLDPFLDDLLEKTPDDLKEKIKGLILQKASDFLETEKTVRRAALATLSRVPDYSTLNAPNREEGDKVFLGKTRELWKELTVHGIIRVDAKTGEKKLINFTDLDGKSCLALLGLAGIHTDDVKYVTPGEFAEGRINFDTGGGHGLVTKEDGKTVIIDHHKDNSGRKTCAAKITYETLVGLGLLKKEKALDDLVDFVTRADNQTFTFEEDMAKLSWRTIVSLRNHIALAHLVDFFEKGRKSTDILSDEDLKNYGLTRKSQEQQGIIEATKKAVREMEENGLIIGSDDYGRIAVDIGKKVPMGFDGVKLLAGGSVYVIWNPPSFFISSVKPFSSDFKPEQGIKVRDTMWIKPQSDETPLTITLKSILGSLTSGKLAPEGKLKEYLDQEPSHQ